MRRVPSFPPVRTAGSLTALSVAAIAALVAAAMAPAPAARAQDARAQDAPLPTAAPDPVGLSPPTVAGSTRDVRLPAARLALAGEVFDIVGAPELAASTRTLTAGMSVQLAAALPDRDPVRVKALLQAVSEGLASVQGDLRDQAVSRIARGFTDAQLGEMLAFYRTPTGALAARRLPLYTRGAMSAVLLVAPKMMETVKDSYCAHVRCTRAEIKALADVGDRIAAAAPQG